MVTDFEDKVGILKEQFFPPPLTADLNNIASVQYLTPFQSSRVVTLEEVQATIYQPNLDKASDINEISNRLLRQILQVFLPHFTHFFQTCIDVRYHPKEFCVANTIVLKKL